MRVMARKTWLLALLAAGSLQAADVWRWTDAQGRVHYSDVPVEGAVRIKSRAAGSGGSSGNAPSQPQATNASFGASQDQRATTAATKAVQDDLAKRQGEQCKTASERYESLLNSRRVYREGKNGERVYLSGPELDQSRVQARQDRDAVCGPKKS